MNGGMAGKILGDGPGGDILDGDIGKRRGVQFEAGIIGGKNQAAARTQEFQGSADHAHMIALDVEHALHAFGIGERRRVEENQVEARAPDLLAFQPSEAIRAEQFMLRSP